MTELIVVIIVLLAVILVGAIVSVKILREYERGVIFRLGRIRPLHGPGVCRVIPGVERLVRIDLRVVSLTIPPQEVISRDNVLQTLLELGADQNSTVVFPLPLDIVGPSSMPIPRQRSGLE